MTDPRPWGPFGMKQWKGHADVYCRVCGWPEYHLWIDDVPPPGHCPDGKTSARSCQRAIDRLMQNAWVRAAAGGKEPQPCMEMLRATTGFSWEEIERMTDASGRSSSKIAEMKSRSVTGH